jgi:hypothetical protein
MPGLTVSEKNHWRDRIAARIDRRIETIIAEDPGLMDRIKAEARRRALSSLGLDELQAELDAVGEQRKALDRREKRAQKAMIARLQGIPAEEVSDNATYSYHFQQTISDAVQRRQAIHEEQLLGEQERGRRILGLRGEKDSLLDTVWLATSPAQIKQLWSKVSELLGDEPTALEREALAIEPIKEG